MFLLAMTTIPPRASSPDFIQRLQRLRDIQTRPFHKLFLSIPHEYRRFPHDCINKTVLDTLESMDWIDILLLEEDYGPASKFLGPLLHRRQEVMDATGIIIIDDDRDYSPTLVERYEDFFLKHPTITVATGNQELYFHRLLYPSLSPDFVDVRLSRTRRVSGFMSFCLARVSPETIDILCRYTQQVLHNVPSAFFHDEGILWIFLHVMDIAVYNINHPFVSSINKEAPEALCENTPTPRTNIEKAIWDWTHSHFPNPNPNPNKILSFPFSPSQTRLQRHTRWG
uniref:Glycosyltransferase 2-like domain-containing protein n=1 Tax=viral metagenome TaxID=1070528 RepID=A0A6C0K727_9ZZZZ